MLLLELVEGILEDYIFILLYEKVLLVSEGLFVKVIDLAGWSECKNDVVLALVITEMLVFMWYLIMVHGSLDELGVSGEQIF